MILADAIRPGLRVVFCGTALGAVAARKRAYYAGPGNAFYETLWRIGLTPRRLEPAEYEELLEYGIGLTDICKTRSGSDQEVGRGGFDVGRLVALLEKNQPGWIAFNGKNSASGAFGHPVEYGPQEERLSGVAAFVLPSTSGAARRYWDLSYWQEFAALVRALATDGERAVKPTLSAPRSSPRA